jgi:hypothetical protein
VAGSDATAAPAPYARVCILPQSEAKPGFQMRVDEIDAAFDRE